MTFFKSAKNLVFQTIKLKKPNKKGLIFARQVLSRKARNELIFQRNNFAGGALAAIEEVNVWGMDQDNDCLGTCTK